jgi:hypothetical protein
MLFTLFLKLLIGHALADFALQTEFISDAKNRQLTSYGNSVPWWIIMSVHCIIHAAFVWMLTNSLVLGILEFVVHFGIDTLRCEGWFSFTTDQVLHVFCKLMWASIVWFILAISVSTDSNAIQSNDPIAHRDYDHMYSLSNLITNKKG